MSCVNEPPGIQDLQMNDAKESTKLTSAVSGVTTENGSDLRRSGRQRASKRSQKEAKQTTDGDTGCNGTVNPAFLGDSDDHLNTTSTTLDTSTKTLTPNPNYLMNGGGHLNGTTPNDAAKQNGTANHITIPEDALLNHHSGRIRLKKKEVANNKDEKRSNNKKETRSPESREKKPHPVSDSVVIPMNGLPINGHVKEKGGEKETTMTIMDNSQQKVKDGVPVSSPLTSEKTAPKKSALEEYFIPANTRKKFLRGEKLYLTNEKRKGTCSWKKVALSACLLAVLAAAVLIGVLAATGILPAGQSEMFTASSPSLELPAQASVSMGSRDDSRLPLTSAVPPPTFAAPLTSTPQPSSRRTSLASNTGESTSATTAANNLVSQLPIVTTQAPVIVPYVLSGQLSVVNRNLSDFKDSNYDKMISELHEELRKVFNETEGFIKVNITRLQQGSIKVQFVTSFSHQNYDPRDIQKVIQAYLDKHNGYLNEFLVDPMSIAVQIPRNECQVSNGGCSDICNWDDETYVKTCSCFDDKDLQADLVTCLSINESPVPSPSSAVTTFVSSTTAATTTPEREVTTISAETDATSEVPTTAIQSDKAHVTEPYEVQSNASTTSATETTTSTVELESLYSTTSPPVTTVAPLTTGSTHSETTISDSIVSISSIESTSDTSSATTSASSFTLILDTTPIPNEDILTTVLSTITASDRGEGRRFIGNETNASTVEIVTEVTVLNATTKHEEGLALTSDENTTPLSTSTSTLSEKAADTTVVYSLNSDEGIHPLNSTELPVNSSQTSSPELQTEVNPVITLSYTTNSNDSLVVTELENATTLEPRVMEVETTSTSTSAVSIENATKPLVTESETTTQTPSVTETILVGEIAVSEPSSTEKFVPMSSTEATTITVSSETTTAVITSTLSSGTSSVSRPAENTRAERNSEATPSNFDTFFTEIIETSENGTILNSVLANDSVNSTNDISAEITEEMVNVNTELTTANNVSYQEINSTDSVPVGNSTELDDNFNVTLSNDDYLDANETLTTESLLNDTLVDELATAQPNDTLVDEISTTLANTTQVIDPSNSTTPASTQSDNLQTENAISLNDTTEFVILNATDFGVDTNSSDEQFLTNVFSENSTTSDVASISGRRLDGDGNATFAYEGDSLSNVTAYDGLVYMNDTEYDSNNSTTPEDGFVGNETDVMTVNDLTNVLDQLINASLIEGCPSDKFTCTNFPEICLNESKLCDGIKDCSDGFDESNCTESCNKNFKCGNTSQCVMRTVLCDGINDCLDGSDEEECGGKAYCDRIQQVSCSDNSYCIKPLEICDGHYNCLDKSDERDCVDRSACQTSGSFFCNDGLCLPPGLKCDGSKDCKGGEDEEEKECKCQGEQQFQCTNGDCISELKRCDGLPDCSDGSDEMECVKVDSNFVIQIFDAKANTWGLLCNDPDVPWDKKGGDELCQELGFSSAERVGYMKVYSNISSYYQWIPNNDLSTGYWLSNVEARNNCNSDAMATVHCVKYECGDLKHEDGTRKKVEQWPFMAIISSENGHRTCRAEILTPLWLITSVGCLKQLPNNYTNWVAKVEQVDLISLALSSNLTQVRQIRNVVSHPHSSIFRSRILFDFDMALIRLTQPLNFDHNMAAVCLPDDEVKSGITCFTSSVKDPNALDASTRKGSITYLPLMVKEREHCNDQGHYNGGVGIRMLCTKSDRLCHKDDAASLACISVEEKWYLAGLLSYQRLCGAYKEHPAVYTNVFAMRNYIEKVVGMKMYNTSGGTILPYKIQEDASIIDGANSADNSIKPLEPFSSHPNASDSSTEYPSDQYLNSTDFFTLEGNETISTLGGDAVTPELDANSTKGNQTEDLDNILINGTVFDELSNSNETFNMSSVVELLDNMNSTTSNVSSVPFLNAGSINNIDLPNDTYSLDDELILSSINTTNANITDDIETTTHEQRIPKPIIVYDADTTTETIVIDENSTVTTVIPIETTSNGTELLTEVYELGVKENTTDESDTTILPVVSNTTNECDGDVFRCLGSPSCTPSENVCDGVYHCPDQSDEWSCVRLNQSTSVVEIRHHSFAWSTICADNWTGDLSHKVCNQLGYMSALVTDHVLLGNQSNDMNLQVENSNSKLVQGVVFANETAECVSGEIVAITCSEFQCGLWSLKTEDGDSTEGRQARRVGSGGSSTEARDGEWPSMAILKNGDRRCSASVLSKRWVLSSWSCLQNSSSNWTVITGTSSSSDQDLGPSISVVDSIFPHPSSGDQNNETDVACGRNDVALVRLSTSLSFGRFTSAVCLPQRSFQPRELCVVAIWEKSQDGLNLFYQPVSTMIDTENQCNSTRLEMDDILCPGLVDGPSYTQQNEPGAVLMCINRSHHWELHGLLSARNSDCHSNSTYTNVYSHSKWIAATIKEN